MSEPYIGEIRYAGFNFAPQRWMLCDGTLLPISEYEVLYQLIGATYGGDGQETFALPDLQSRIPLHIGSDGFNNYSLGESFGAETVAVNVFQIGLHTHPYRASTGSAVTAAPAKDSYLASNPNQPLYTTDAASLTRLPSNAIAVSGGDGNPHDNLMPYLCLNFIICVEGIYPSQT